MQLQTVGYY